MLEPRTFWNGEPCAARRLTVAVPEWRDGVDPPLAWWKHMAGTPMPVVEVRYRDQVHVLADDDGSGWAKVTEGHGGPNWPSRHLPTVALDHEMVLVPLAELRHLLDVVEVIDFEPPRP